MDRKKILIMFLTFACFLLSACSDDDGESSSEVKLENMQPLVLAKYESVRFESIPYSDDGTETTQYGYSKGEKDNIAYFSILNNGKTYFNTYLSIPSEGSNFDYYVFHKNTGSWNVYPVENLRPTSDTVVLTTISDGSGDGNFTLRGVFNGGNSYSDYLQGNVKGYNSKGIRFNVIHASETPDALGNLYVQFPSAVSDEILGKTFRQAVVCDVNFNPMLSNNNCIILIDYKALQHFTNKGQDTVVVSNAFYNKNTKKATIMAIAYRFGLREDKTDTLNLMHPDNLYYHLNKDQWNTINRNVR